jgi:outer membrane protein assembly factor BamB
MELLEMLRISGLGSLLAFVALGHAAIAAPSVKLSLASLPPNAPLGVTGAGFADSEAIDVYVDTVDTALLVSTATGTFSATERISAALQPGKHYITAIGRKSGDAAQTAFTVSTPWAEQGFGASGRAWNAWENTISPSNVGTLGLLWAAPTDPVYSSPAVANGAVYVATPAGISSLTTSGHVSWTTALTGSFYSSPAVSGTRIFAASNAGGVYALSTAGTKLWGALPTADFAYASPVVVNGVVYIGDTTGRMYALNATTGATLWTYASAGEAIYSTAAVVNGIVYFGSYSGMVYALNATTGALIWSYTTGSQIRSTPAVVNGVVYIGSFDSYIYALVATGANGGTLLWKDELNYDIWSSPAVADGAVYIASAGGTVYAFDPHTGTTKWSFASGETMYSDISVANGIVYVGANTGSLYAFNDANGFLLWTADLGDPAWGRPLVSDGVVYTNSQQGRTSAFALQAGNNALPLVRPPRMSTLHPDYSLRVQLKH